MRVYLPPGELRNYPLSLCTSASRAGRKLEQLRLPPEQEQLVADTPAHVEAGGDIKGEGVDVLPGETNDARASNPAVYTAI